MQNQYLINLYIAFNTILGFSTTVVMQRLSYQFNDFIVLYSLMNWVHAREYVHANVHMHVHLSGYIHKRIPIIVNIPVSGYLRSLYLLILLSHVWQVYNSTSLMRTCSCLRSLRYACVSQINNLCASVHVSMGCSLC